MYMYYGERTNFSLSSGDGTFDFFEDFSGDLSKWTIDPENTDNTVYIWNNTLRHDPDSSQTKNSYFDTRIQTTTYKILNGIIEYRVYLAGSTSSSPRIIHQMGWRVPNLNFSNGYCWRLQNSAADAGHLRFTGRASWAVFGTAYPATTGNVWHSVKEVINGTTFTGYVDGGSGYSGTDTTKQTADYLVSHVHGVTLTSASYALVDDIRVRKYASPEPSASVSNEVLRFYPQGMTVNIGNISSGLSPCPNWTLQCVAFDSITSSAPLNSTKARIPGCNLLPTITLLSFDDANPTLPPQIDLTVGGITAVLCNGTASDPDGYFDIVNVSAVLYASGNGTLPTSPPDNNTLYQNSSCTLSDGYSATKKDFNCSFSLFYYAQNGTWSCNATATDSQSASGSAVANSTVNNLIAFNLSSLILDYGNLVPGSASASSVVYYITNLGNTRIDLSLNGTNMSCTIGAIGASYQHYNITGTDQAYAQMRALSNSAFLASDFNLDKKVTSDSNRTTYWRIQIPQAVKGSCTGIIALSAQQG
ncbi:MAG: DUF2341 domain-containing protein [Candidatus Woesearchaeota archaeon]|nr:DUF2341 domain-containing protein [Candidatus Woesearchaeota archaeon]